MHLIVFLLIPAGTIDQIQFKLYLNFFSFFSVYLIKICRKANIKLILNLLNATICRFKCNIQRKQFFSMYILGLLSVLLTLTFYIFPLTTGGNTIKLFLLFDKSYFLMKHFLFSNVQNFGYLLTKKLSIASHL